MADFFISYARPDREWAKWIAWVLEEEGYSTIYQARDFPPGSRFVQKIHKASLESDCTLAVLSPEYLSSEFTSSEWEAAWAQRKLLPVRIKECEPPGLLSAIAYIDLVGLDRDAARQALVTGVSETGAQPRVKPSASRSQDRPLPFDLAALPEGKIPDVGPLPSGSRMPLSVNPLFVGREEDLRILARYLKADETGAVGEVKIAAVTGPGGIGKTQLAAEFVHRYGRYFRGGVCWMSFADPNAVPAEVAACGRGLALHPSYDTLSLEQQLFLVKKEWQDVQPHLLVFDNCEEEALLDRWRPTTGAARVLVTSRRRRWGLALGVKAVSLEVLPRTASVELLRRFRPDLAEGDPTLAAIAEELANLPLAIHLAGSFLQRYAYSPSGQPMAYLAALRRKGLLGHPSLQGKAAGISPTGHEAHVARTFALSFERLDAQSPIDVLAKDLLARASFFAPGEPIPRVLLIRTVDSNSREDDDTRIEDALARLTTELGLLEEGTDGGLTIHRLVAFFARTVDDGEGAQRAVEKAVFAEASRLNETGIPGPLLVWQRQLRAVTEGARGREDTIESDLCQALGRHLWIIGDYSGGRPFHERALAIREKILGPEHPDTASSLWDIGILLLEQGDLIGTRPYLERALLIREKVLGTEHPDTARSLNSLGVFFRRQGDFEAARSCYERTLTIWEKVLGPEHPKTAISLNNLGLLLADEGDPSGARSYYLRALAIQEKVMGSEHPDTARSFSNLGALLASQGDLEGARPYYERALAIQERILGPEHPDTAQTLSYLGNLLQRQGDLGNARLCHKRALAIREKILGPEHLDTALSLSDLGNVFESQFNFSGARHYKERALKVFEARLGSEHPDTQRAQRNLQSLGSRAPRRRGGET